MSSEMMAIRKKFRATKLYLIIILTMAKHTTHEIFTRRSYCVACEAPLLRCKWECAEMKSALIAVDVMKLYEKCMSRWLCLPCVCAIQHWKHTNLIELLHSSISICMPLRILLVRVWLFSYEAAVFNFRAPNEFDVHRTHVLCGHNEG